MSAQAKIAGPLKTLLLSCALLASAGAGIARASPRESETAYLQGLVNERFGRPQDALAFYQRAARLDPSSRFLQEALANLCLGLGRLDEAAAAAGRVADLSAGDPSAQVLLGRIHLAQGDRAAASRSFDAALSSDPVNGEALLYAAYAHAAGEPAQAIGFLERYLKENPESTEALVHIAQLEESLRDFAAAEKTWRKAAGRDPSDPSVHAALGRLAEARGDQAAAQAEYETARFLDPRNSQILVSLGEIYYRQGRLPEAKEALGQALRLEPGETAARFGLALAAEDLGDWEEAVRQMSVVADVSDQPGVPLQLAYDQSMAGRPKDALKTLRRARRKDPKNADIPMYMGLVYEDLKSPRRAVRCFEDVLALDPSRSDAHFHLATGWDLLGRFDRAEPHLLKAVELDPKNGAALNYLGYSWADRSVHLEDALALIHRAVALEPDNEAFLDSLGWCLFKSGRAAEAEPVLARATRMEDAVVWEHYGDVLKSLGRSDEAVRAWQEGYLQDPGSRSLLERLGGRGQAGRVEKLTAPRAILKGVEGNFRPLRGLAGRVDVSVREGGRSYAVDGIFYYSRPQLFRVEILGAFMAPQALLIQNATGLHAVAADGSPRVFPAGGDWFRLLGDVLSGEFARRFDDPSVRVEQKESRLTYRAGFGELEIDGRGKVLTRAALSGGPTLSFGDYEEVEGVRFPGTVRVEVPSENMSVSLSFHKLRMNPALAADLFKTPEASR